MCESVTPLDIEFRRRANLWMVKNQKPLTFSLKLLPKWEELPAGLVKVYFPTLEQPIKSQVTNLPGYWGSLIDPITDHQSDLMNRIVDFIAEDYPLDVWSGMDEGKFFIAVDNVRTAVLLMNI